MAKTSGDFNYRIRTPKKGEKPFNAIVHIVPTSFSTEGDDWPLLSPQLMTEGEIDWHIRAYKEDLDRVGRLAKRALKRANQRTRGWVREGAEAD